MTQILYEQFCDSPVGVLRLMASSQGLLALEIKGTRGERYLKARLRKYFPDRTIKPESTAALASARSWLESYFSSQSLPPLPPFHLVGTEFERAVWAILRTIPYGITWSYADVARVLGSPKLARAVGRAVGHNPIGFMIPCHRVVAASGRLAGYAGGLENKAWLLKLENVTKTKPQVGSARG